MKKYAHLAFAFATTALLAGTTATAQDKKDSKETKEQKEEKVKLKQYDEIIIRKKTDKDGRLSIEIRDGDVFVDGKPMDDYESEDLSVRRAKTGRTITISPFRNGGAQTFNFENGQPLRITTGGTRTFLGVVTEEAPGGARILNVSKGSPAEKAGLKEKDVITRIGDEKVKDENDVSRIIRARKPDEEVKIVVLRNGKETTINTKLGKIENEAPNIGLSLPGHEFGFSLPRQDLNLDELQRSLPKAFEWSPNGINPRSPRLGIKAQDTEDGKGVKVLEVSDESAAEKAGIKEDDIITEFDGKAVNSTDELSRLTNSSFREKSKVPVKLLRGNKSMNLEVVVPKKLKTANL